MSRPRRYPWEEWFALGRFRILVDSPGRHRSIAQQVRNAASRRGFRVSIKTDGCDLDIRVIKEGKDGP